MLPIFKYFEIMFFVLLFTFLCYRNFNAKRKPSPIPTNWPLVGMLPALFINIHRIHDFVTAALQISGTEWFKGLWFANMDILLISDPTNVHYILSKNFSNFNKGPEFKKIFDILGDGIFNAESESWENQRRTIMPLINHHGFQKFIAQINWKKVEGGLVPILEKATKTGEEVDLQELLQRLAFDTACIMVLGHDPVSLSIDMPHLPYDKAFSDAEEAILYRHILPEIYWKFEKWLQFGKEKKLTQAKDVVDQFLMHCISLKRQKLKANDENGNEDFAFLTSYMKAVEETSDESNPVSENVWKDTMLNLIFAGKDTISATLTWFFWLLATNPIEENKIRQEIRTNLPVDENGKWKFSSTEELKKLVYLHGALCESLRLYPAVPLQHKAPINPDVLPSGHKIKPNTKTVLSFYSMGRMESIWGKDCFQFKPERWITEQGRIKHEPSFKFPAFNAGPRSCLGKETSYVQMKIVAASIISSFHFEVVEDHTVAPSTSVVLHMKHGLKVTTNWPLVRMLPALILNIHRVHECITDFLQIYGTFWFKGLWSTNMDMLVTSDPANVHYILSKKIPNFTKGPEFKKIFDTFGDGFLDTDTSWESQRSTIRTWINHQGFQKLVATISWKNVEEGLIPILDIATKTGKEVDMQELFRNYTFDSACILVLGQDPASLCIDLPHFPCEKAFADAEEAIFYRHIRPETYWKFEKWLQIGKEKKLSEAKDTLDQFLMHCISLQCQKVKAMDENEYLSFLKISMEAFERTSDAPNPISENAWKGALLSLIVAGKDTVSAALTWFFWLLAKNPVEENKIRQEIMMNLQVDENGKWNFSST